METNYAAMYYGDMGNFSLERVVQEREEALYRKEEKKLKDEVVPFVKKFSSGSLQEFDEKDHEKLTEFSQTILEATTKEEDRACTANENFSPCVVSFEGQNFTLQQGPDKSSLTISTNTSPPISQALPDVTMDQLELAASVHSQSLSEPSGNQTEMWGQRLLTEDKKFALFVSVIKEVKQKNSRFPSERIVQKSTSQAYKDNQYINKVADLCKQYEYAFSCRLFNCLENKDNNQLDKHMQFVLEDAGGLSRYPLDQSSSTSVTSNVILTGPLAYTFFVDRVLSVPSHSRRAKQEPYGPDRFEGSHRDTKDCTGDYVSCCFTALHYLYSSQMVFANATDTKALFEILKETNRLARGESDSVLSLGREIRSPEADIRRFYEESFDQNIVNRSFVPATLLNSQISPSLHYYHQLNDMTLVTHYESEDKIISFFSKHLNHYQCMLDEAKTDDEKMTAIIIFISILEASHYFSNGNNRLCCQMLINKLLIENNLTQTILYIPNGFSRYVLSSLPWQVRIGVIDLERVPLSVLRERLEPALMMVREGQLFFQKAQEMSYPVST